MRSWPALVVSGLGRTGDADLLQAALTDHDVAAIEETSDDTWRVFFHLPAARDRAVDALRETFPALSIEAIDVADEDWAMKSQENLRALQVGRIIVRSEEHTSELQSQ